MLTAEPGGTVVAHWHQLGHYIDDDRVWTAPEWADHLNSPARDHPFTTHPAGERRAVMHVTVRLHPLDRSLDHAEWAEIGHRIARTAALTPAGDSEACRWIAVQARPGRLDVIASLIRADGHWAALPRHLARELSAEARRIEADLALHTSGQHPGTSTSPHTVGQFSGTAPLRRAARIRWRRCWASWPPTAPALWPRSGE